MAGKEDEDKTHKLRFISLVFSLYKSAWLAMGKEANPLTGKVEKDMNAAHGSIDLLETLKVKTKGNLSSEEERVISGYLSALQLNFVDESSKEEAEPGEKKKEAAEPDKKEKKEVAAEPGKEKAPGSGDTQGDKSGEGKPAGGGE